MKNKKSFKILLISHFAFSFIHELVLYTLEMICHQPKKSQRTAPVYFPAGGRFQKKSQQAQIALFNF